MKTLFYIIFISLVSSCLLARDINLEARYITVNDAENDNSQFGNIYLDEAFTFEISYRASPFGVTLPDDPIFNINFNYRIYLSHDEVLDTTDQLLNSINTTTKSNIDLTIRYIDDQKISPSLNFLPGRAYLILVLDEDYSFTQEPSTHRDDNVVVQEVLIRSRFQDLALHKINTYKYSKDSMLFFGTSITNSGDVDITGFTYSISVANSIAELNTPLIENEYVIDSTIGGITYKDRIYTDVSELDISGLNLKLEEFYIQWKIYNILPDDSISSNNLIVKKFNWSQLDSNFNPNKNIHLSQDDQDTIKTCEAFVYDDGGYFKDYSNDVRGSLLVLPDAQNKLLQLSVKETNLSEGDFLQVYRFSDDRTYYIPYDLNDDLIVYPNSPFDSLEIRFTSNSYGTNDGFKVDVSCIDTNIIEQLHIDTHEEVITCNKRILDFTKDHYSNNNSGKASITFLPDEPNKVIQIQSRRLKLNPQSNNYIALYTKDDLELRPDYTYTKDNDYFIQSSHRESGAVTIEYESSMIFRDRFDLEVSCVAPYVLQIPTSDHLTIKSCDTTILDNGNITNYLGNSNGLLTILPEDSLIPIQLKASLFDLHVSDTLKVFNGPTGDVDNELIGSYSDQEFPNIIESIHESGALTLQFISDGQNESKGFNLWSKCVAKEHIMLYQEEETIYTCGSKILDNGGRGNYKSESHDTLIIYPSIPGQLVKLDVEEFRAFWIRLYDGPSTEYKEVENVWPKKLDTSFTYSATNETGALTLILNTQSGGYEGFVFNSSCVTPEQVLAPVSTNNQIVGCNHFITDHNYLLDYSNNRNDSLTIFPYHPDSPIELTFNQLNTEEGKDILTVYNGIDTRATLLGTFSGTELPENILSSDSVFGALTLKFTSNETVESLGFHLNATCKKPEHDLLTNNLKEIYTCEKKVVAFNGDHWTKELTIYPNVEDANVILELESFTGTNGDIVRIYNGTSSNDSLIKHVDFYHRDVVLKASNPSGALTLVYEDDYDGTNSRDEGFVFDVSCDRYNSLHPVQVTKHNSLSQRSGCDFTILDNGSLYDNYSNNSSDTLVVFPDQENKAIHLRFIEFNTELNQDMLSIYNGFNTFSDEVISLSGEISPNSITSEDQENGAFTLVFNSDVSNNFDGYEIEISCKDLLPQLRADNITIDSSIIYNGDTIKGQFKVINSGFGTASDVPYHLYLYRRFGTTFQLRDTLLSGVISNIGALDEISVPFMIDADSKFLANADYQIVLEIDPKDVLENNVDDNTPSTFFEFKTKYSELVAESISLDQTIIYDIDTLSGEINVKNQGEFDAINIPYSIFLTRGTTSPSQIIDTIFQGFIDRLNSMSETNIDFKFHNALENNAEGKYYLILKVNSDGTIKETNPIDNNTSVMFNYKLALPDIEAKDLLLDKAFYERNDTVFGSFTASNTGKLNATNVPYNIYLHRGYNGKLTGIIDTISIRTLDLMSSSQLKIDFQIYLNQYTIGDDIYDVTVKLNEGEVVNEQNFDNNLKSTIFNYKYLEDPNKDFGITTDFLNTRTTVFNGSCDLTFADNGGIDGDFVLDAETSGWEVYELKIEPDPVNITTSYRAEIYYHELSSSNLLLLFYKDGALDYERSFDTPIYGGKSNGDTITFDFSLEKNESFAIQHETYEFERITGKGFHGRIYCTDVVTKTKNLVEKNELFINPNPTNDFLYLQNLSHQEGSFEIISNNGHTLKKGNLKDRINVSDLAQGLYFLSLKQNEKTQMLKFVKE